VAASSKIVSFRNVNATLARKRRMQDGAVTFCTPNNSIIFDVVKTFAAKLTFFFAGQFFVHRSVWRCQGHLGFCKCHCTFFFIANVVEKRDEFNDTLNC
jgi:hypothetical protein